MNYPTPTTSSLDEAEWIHLALHAMNLDHHEEAIDLLKRATEAFPKNAQARYLLGAEHAQIGLYDRAVADIAAAIQMDLRLNVAHFQLGQLHWAAGRIEAAEVAWQPLDALELNDSLRLFKSALLHLVRDEFDRCIAMLKQGIEQDNAGPALRADMQRLLADLERRRGMNSGGKVETSNSVVATLPDSLNPQRRILPAYEQNNEAPAD